MFGRKFKTVVKAPFVTAHYRAVAAIFSVFADPMRALTSYVLSRGEYPWEATLKTPVGPVNVSLYGPHDVRTVVEIFCRQEYGPSSGAVVVDVGSNIGISALFFLTRQAGTRVYCYEPDPRNVSRLRANLAPFGAQIEVHEVALAPHGGTALFRREATGRYGGLAATSPREGLSEILVDCVGIADALDAVLDREQQIDLLKIDTEGSEASLVAAIGPAQRARVAHVVYETNDAALPIARLSWGGRPRPSSHPDTSEREEPLGANRTDLVGLLRGSPPAQLLKRSPLGANAKFVAHTIFSPRDFVRGYRFGQQLPMPVREDSVPPSATPANPLEAYFDAVTEGPGIWKWRHYFDVYHRHLAKFRGRPVNIVEIGIFSGGSLGMWRDYFGPQCHVYGVDIAPECRVYENDNVTVFIGDQGDPAFWREFVSQVAAVDIVIDDGGHRPYQQITTLEALLPHMRPGGVYVCEDIVGPMQPFLSYVDGLTRGVSGAERGPSTALQNQIASVHRYPLVTVLEKPAGPVADFDAPHHGTEWQPILPSIGWSAG